MALIPLAIGVIGGMKQGDAASAAADSQAYDARQNAGFANDAANDAIARGRHDSDIQRLKTSQMIGTQRSVGGSSGGDVNTGSNALIQQDTAGIGEFDALVIENNAAREAYGYKVQAIQGLSNANKIQSAGQQAKRDSLLGGILGGVSGMAGGMGGGDSGAAASAGGTYGKSGVAVNGKAGFSAGRGQGR